MSDERRARFLARAAKATTPEERDQAARDYLQECADSILTEAEMSPWRNRTTATDQSGSDDGAQETAQKQ